MNYKKITCYQTDDGVIHMTELAARLRVAWLEDQKKQDKIKALQRQRQKDIKTEDIPTDTTCPHLKNVLTLRTLRADFAKFSIQTRNTKNKLYDLNVKFSKSPTPTRQKRLRKLGADLEFQKRCVAYTIREIKEIKRKLYR